MVRLVLAASEWGLYGRSQCSFSPMGMT
jgi:hypothetical protein